MHVLFVDDDKVVSQSVQLVLQQRGYDCETVDLGQDAIALAKDNAYDVIVLDIGLPDMDGYHVIRRLKMDGIKTPVLLQSGLAGQDLPSEAAALGITEYLAKPFSVNELIARMESVIANTVDEEPEPARESAGEPPPQAPAEAQPLAAPEPAPAQRETPEKPVPSDDHDDRRRSARESIYEAALITEQGPPIPCAIINLSQTGAAIRLSIPDQPCPTLFTLRPLDGPERRCEVRWRREDQIGVEFI